MYIISTSSFKLHYCIFAIIWKSYIFYFWFCLFGRLFRLERNILTTSCLSVLLPCTVPPSWSHLPYSISVWIPCRLTAGWRHGSWLSSLLLYLWFLDTVTFRATNCPYCLGLSWYSHQESQFQGVPKSQAILALRCSSVSEKMRHL